MDVKRLPKPTSYEMLKQEIEFIKATKPCKTLVIDTIDWAESLIIEHLCKANNKSSIEKFGYGAGYVFLKEEEGRFLNLLEEVISEGINVVLTAHAQIRKFEEPNESGSYDRYELKLGKRLLHCLHLFLKSGQTWFYLLIIKLLFKKMKMARQKQQAEEE